MTLALQLVTFFSSVHLPRLFASLKQQTRQDWTLFVRDQSKNAEEIARVKLLLEQSGLPFVFESGENLGFGAGHNRLFSKHQADAIALVNPDIVFEPTYYERILQVMEQDRVFGSLQGVLLHAGEQEEVVDSLGLKVRGFGDIRDLGTGEPLSRWTNSFAGTEVTSIFGVAGAAPVYRRTALERARSTHGAFFDERFFLYKEDVELAIRLYRAGQVAGLVVTARAEHVRTLARRSLWMRFKNEFTRPKIIRLANYTNQWRIYALHMEWGSSLSAWSASLTAETGRTLGLALFAPSVFVQAMKSLLQDRSSLLASRQLYLQRFSLRWYL